MSFTAIVGISRWSPLRRSIGSPASPPPILNLDHSCAPIASRRPVPAVEGRSLA
jgi:hypothetical protein